MSRPRMPKVHRDAPQGSSSHSYATSTGPEARHHRRKPTFRRPLVYLADGQTLVQSHTLPCIPEHVGFAADRPLHGTFSHSATVENFDELAANNPSADARDHDPFAEHLTNEYDPVFLPPSPSMLPAQSRHRRKREAQWKRWSEDVIPHLIDPYMELMFATDSLHNLPSPPQIAEPCTCGKSGKVLDITVVKFSELVSVQVRACECRPAARQLVALGCFPCAPYHPTLAVDMRMLDFVTRLFVRISPNNTAWCGAIEDFLNMQGYRLAGQGSLRRRFRVALQWYNSLQHAVNAHIDDALRLIRHHITRLEDGLPYASDPVAPEQSYLWMVSEGAEDDAPPPTASGTPRTTMEEVEDEDETPQQARQKRQRSEPPEEGAPNTPFPKPTPRLRPSDYLRARCPLCFGGNRREDLCGPDAIVCIDACFTQKHNKQAPDPPRNHPRTVFVSEKDAKIVEDYVEAVRPPQNRPKKKAKSTEQSDISTAPEDGYEGPLRVPTSVLDGCEESFLAADDRREKASTQFFGSTALMSLLCRHDRVLWLVNMTSAGEKQHYALVLLEMLFQNLPLSFSIGLLYDIGCQIHRSCIKWGFLKPYLHRLAFAISIFHAFGHQWPCQIIYHPRKCKGFGLSDREGCERFWHSISKLIAYLRVCGHHQRLYTIDNQVQHADAENLEKLGRWLFRRTQHCLNKRVDAEEVVRLCEQPVELLRAEWAAQVAAQTRPLPRRSKNAGKKAVDDIIRLRKSCNLLSDRLDVLLNTIADSGAAQYLIADAETKYTSTSASLKRVTTELQQKERVLGVVNKQKLNTIASNPYVSDRMNALALKTRLRDRLRSRKFELDRLERSFRKQLNERKVHNHTEASVKRRDPSIQQLAHSYNQLCDKIAMHIHKRVAPAGSICPKKIEPKGLFALDIDNDIWQDVGLLEGTPEAPPLWLANDQVRSGIAAMLELDRCREEEARLRHECRSMQEWFTEEWNTVTKGFQIAPDPGAKHQFELRRKALLRLCAIWQKSVDSLPRSTTAWELLPWGPTSEELLDVSVEEVTASWGGHVDHDDGSDIDNESVLDEEGTDFDLGLINTLDTVDLADAYHAESPVEVLY